ncbi:MAG: aminoacyl-tRNA hydrolase [Actinomycetota bacterium]|nr:aminoacyl-tRNA hydrolase [Actinomycetota bacterium]
MGLFDRGRPAPDDSRWIIAGLGNPGARYEKTRHNAGALVVDELLRRKQGSFKRHKSGCLVAEVGFGDGRMVLARPVSYMNESGRPLRELVRWYKSGPDHLVVVHDELDIPFGEVRIKLGGGTAGHNGLKSIASHFGTKDFPRVRVGISRPRGGQDAADYVLSDFSSAERKELEQIVARAADAAERIVEVGLERAMNEVNTRPA